MKNIFSYFFLVLLVISSCTKDDDPIIEPVDDILRIEAYLTLDGCDFEITYPNTLDTIKYGSTHYIWFNTIEGGLSYNDNENTFNSDFNVTVLGSDITGSLEATRYYDADNVSHLNLVATRKSESSTITSYGMDVDFIPLSSEEIIEGKKVETFEIVGTEICNYLNSTYYDFTTDSYVDALINYTCPATSSISIKIFHAE